MKTINIYGVRLLTIFAAVFFVSIISGCGSSKTTDKYADLSGTEWTMFEMNENKYEAPEKVTIKFDETGKKVTGKAPCNSYGAASTINSNKLSFSDIYSTKMFCDNMKDEQDFMDALKKVYAYQTAKDMLYFFNSDGNVIFRFKEMK
jgi:heat shock protein HslJ